MSTKLFVGNLSIRTKEDELKNLFSQFGKVVGCNIIKLYAFVVSIIMTMAI